MNNKKIYDQENSLRDSNEGHTKNMKVFLMRCIIFVLSFILARCIIEFLTPYDHGNLDVQTKRNFLTKNNLKPDLFITGSSKILRGVKADLFDSIRNKENASQLQAYNLGSAGTLIGENRYLIRNYLDEGFSDSCKTIFVEWVNSYDPNPAQQYSERATYWMGPREYLEYMEMEARMSFLSIPERLKFMWLYTQMFMINMSGVARFKEQLVRWNERPTERWFDKDGYMAYQGHAPYLPSENVENPLAYFDTSAIDFQRRRAIELHDKKYEFVNRADIRQWNQLINTLHEKGIRLVLLIVPMGPDDRVVGLTHKIPEGHLIDLSDPRLFPDLYDKRIYFDRIHFNDEGARRFTRHLAEEWLKTSKNCKHR